MNKHIGSRFEAFLQERGLDERVAALAAKQHIVATLTRAMARRQLSKAELARRMATARPAVYRLLDPRNPSLTLGTLTKAMEVLEVASIRLGRAPAATATRTRPRPARRAAAAR